MAQLKDTVVSGSLRATDSLLTTTLQTKILKAPTESNGTTYGVGTSGQVLKSNGTGAYWASDSQGVTSVTIKTSSPLSGGSNTAVTSTGTWTISLGTVGVGNGGTGVTSFTANSLIMSGSTTTSALTTRAITDRTTVSSLTNVATWAASTNIPTVNLIAYWDGRYQTTNNASNLSYCSKGAFGNACTYAVDDATANGALGTGTGLTTERSVYYGLVTVNGATQSRANAIYGPTTAGTSGYLVKSNGSGAPGWIQATDSNTASTVVQRSSTGTFTISGITATGSPGFYNEVTAGSYSYLRLKSGTGTWDIATKDNELSGSLQFRPGGASKGTYIGTDGRIYAPAVQTPWVDVATSSTSAYPRVKFWFNSTTSVWTTGIWSDGSGNYAYRIYLGDEIGFNMVASTKTIHPGASWAWGTPSSRSTKNTINPLKDYGSILDQLKPVSFYYNEDLDRHLNLGLIYEDTVNLLPEICRGANSPSTYNINYTALVPILLKEIQSLRKRTRDLEIQLSFLTQENILKE